MRRIVLAAAAALLLSWAAPQAAVRPPKLEYTRFQLPNGLIVILHQDRSPPNGPAAPASPISSST
jgi:hypothetical protein